jgi:hypothetical protein
MYKIKGLFREIFSIMHKVRFEFSKVLL